MIMNNVSFYDTQVKIVTMLYSYYFKAKYGYLFCWVTDTLL